MQKVTIQEKVSVWQDVCIEFDDSVDISTTEKLKQAIHEGKWWDINATQAYWETEEHLDYDYDKASLNDVLYSTDESHTIRRKL